MTAMRHFKKLSGALAVVAVSVSCGDVVRQGSSPVFLVIDQLTASPGSDSGATKRNTLLSDVLTNVTQPAPCSTNSPCPTVFNDLGEVTLRTLAKDVSAVSPSSNSEVTISRYRVSYHRADGHNTPGVDVPYGFDGAATGTSSGGKLTLTFEIVRHVSKMESPLVELATGPTIITTIADVSFYGRDQVGNDVSVTGSMQIDFGNFADK
jgi:hypothetical protein